MTSEQQIIAEQAAEIERLKNKVASLEDRENHLSLRLDRLWEAAT